MREDLKAVIKQYQPDDVFNCDKTGLYWKIEIIDGTFVKNKAKTELPFINSIIYS